MRYLIDAHSWIEYLEGSEIGKKVSDILEAENEIFVLGITIAEVISKVKRKKQDISTAYKAIINNAQVIEITPKIAKEAGLLHAQKRKDIASFGIVDALLITTARNYQYKLITGDRHFKDFPETLLFNK